MTLCTINSSCFLFSMALLLLLLLGVRWCDATPQAPTRDPASVRAVHAADVDAMLQLRTALKIHQWLGDAPECGWTGEPQERKRKKKKKRFFV